MTGFGRSELEQGGLRVLAEVRTLNQRFFEIKFNLPRGWGEQEAELRRLASAVISRGRVELMVRILTPRVLSRLTVNEELARRYVGELRRLKRSLKLAGEPDLEALLQRPEIFQLNEEAGNQEAELRLAMRAVKTALKTLDNERTREGRVLKQDLRRHLNTTTSAVKRIVRISQQSRKDIIANFQARVREMLANMPVDEKRLYEEASASAQRADISEELARLDAHLKALAELFERPGPVGKEIEFWLQEVGREVNTIGSKSQNPDLSRSAVEIKGALEKMREQVQNVE